MSPATSWCLLTEQHAPYFQGGVHGEEPASTGAAQRAQDGDRVTEAEGAGDAAGHPPQGEHGAGKQQAEQLQEGALGCSPASPSLPYLGMSHPQSPGRLISLIAKYRARA